MNRFAVEHNGKAQVCFRCGGKSYKNLPNAGSETKNTNSVTERDIYKYVKVKKENQVRETKK